MTGVLLDPRTGRPEGDPPTLADVPGKGVLYNYMCPDVDLERELYRAPGQVQANLARAQREAPFEPRASMQAWEETLYAPLADGAAVTAAAEATMVPIFTLPANYLYPGRLMKWTVMGRQSTAITTPGTITLRLAYSATGLGAVVVAASGAFAPDPTAAATNLTFMVEWWGLCRAVGTSGSMMGWGRIEWSDYDDATVATIVGNLNMRMAPASAPAVATIDTTVARALNPTYQPSVATASMTAHAAFLEALT
jgi:hypothetical protein